MCEYILKYFDVETRGYFQPNMQLDERLEELDNSSFALWSNVALLNSGGTGRFGASLVTMMLKSDMN